MSQRILVTGATGFVGSHLVRRLVSEGYSVRILRREMSSLDVLGGVAFEEVIGDITDPQSVDRAVAGCDVVFHSAAMIEYRDDLNAIQTKVNVEGARHMVESALRHKVQRFIHVSSVMAIGYHPDGSLADEQTLYNLGPVRMNYADTKYAAERIVRDGVAHGLDAVIVNPGAIYGPGERRRVSQIKGLAGPLTSRGGIAVVDVDDVVEGCCRAWQQGKTGERYILIAENMTYQEIGRAFARELNQRGPRICLPAFLLWLLAIPIAFIARLLGRRASFTPTMARVAQIRFHYSNRKARDELGMTFRPFRETAHRTIAWMRRRGLE